ncbi:hypothetical protein EV363DRAFT_1528881 [Boletus edulis]|nr:hypothetical protein EV363DRAFT_1528881 [Boletus edulis]
MFGSFLRLSAKPWPLVPGKFRVLIIGKSGVGKSSLINKVFGVAGVDVSNTTRGRASIDQEYVAPDNERFVVHDSCGFEAADQNNLKAVRDFISRRRRMPELKDQLHAIWLCLAIPFAGARLLEAGVEDFLKKRKQILGNIPLVVVFTKLDLLVNALYADALRNEEPDDQALNERKLESLERLCLRPVRAAAGSDYLSHVLVSTTEGYEESLAALVDVTTKDIQKYVKDEAVHYIAAIAQRVSISVKIALTMSVGEKRYWKALTASPNFRNQSMKACLDVIHKDVITVWNLNDPQNIVGLVSQRSTSRKTSITVVAALVTIIASVAGTGGAALPIIVPVAGAAILVKLAHNIYRTSQDIVKQLMAYIVDLTCVMQAVFLLVSVRNGIVDVEVIAMAMQAYEKTNRVDVHTVINNFEVNLAVAPGKRDHVLDKIKELIRSHSVGDEEISNLRKKLQTSSVPPDDDAFDQQFVAADSFRHLDLEGLG